MDIQTIAGTTDLIVNAITIILFIIAAALAIKKKNNIAFAFGLLGTLAAFYFTHSPLLCWIISIAVIIWVSLAKGSEVKQVSIKPISNKQPLKSSKSSVNYEAKRMVKPGPIIGLILGILMAGFPIIGFMIQEPSLSDSQGKMIGFGFIIFGAFMVIVNIIVLVTGKENLLSNDASPTSTTTTITTVSKAKSEEGESDSGNKIRCRFCKKLYSSDYNGCPYCKKK